MSATFNINCSVVTKYFKTNGIILKKCLTTFYIECEYAFTLEKTKCLIGI